MLVAPAVMRNATNVCAADASLMPGYLDPLHLVLQCCCHARCVTLMSVLHAAALAAGVG
jgi:hypothetical protein